MKIGLLDHMGYGNLGDAATQDVVIANIRRRLPSAEIVAFSEIPGDTARRHSIPCYPLYWSTPTPETVDATPAAAAPPPKTLKSVLKKIPIVYAWAKPLVDLAREAIFWVRSFRILRTLDVLIISGGGQFDDLWHGPWGQSYTVFKFCFLTKLARKKVFLLNVGVGGLRHPLSRLFARCAVRLADYRAFRDQDSQERMRSLGVRGKTHVSPDCAYALDPEPYLDNAPSSQKPMVGLNPTGFCDPRLWPRKDNAVYQSYLEKITRFSLWLLEQGYDLRIFTTDWSVDRYAINDLKSRLGSHLSSPERMRAIFPPVSESVDHVLRQMAAFDFVITSKYHGLVFSHVLKKPVISLSYQRKMDVAMRAMAQERFCANIEHFELEWLKSAFCALVDEKSRVIDESAAIVQKYAVELSTQFDELFFPSRASVPRVSSQMVSAGEKWTKREPGRYL